MTAPVAERYRRVAAGFTDRVEAVPDDRWDDPTPCEDWRARDLVGHVAGTSGTFLGFIGREPPAGPTVEDDPVAAWATARDAVQAALDDPEVAATEFEGGLGRSTFAQAVDRFLCTDLLVHGWDLARATGGDERMDPQEVARVFADVRPLGDRLRSPGVFGPERPAPAGADEQARLLAFLGRDPGPS